VVALPAITTSVATLAAMQTEPINLDIAQRCVEDIVLVTDDDMREAARWLWFEMGLATDLSGAAAVAAVRAGRFRPAPGKKVCALVCGAGSDALR
jgi:threonine dehydratase